MPPRVTVNQGATTAGSPSEQLIKAATKEAMVTDARGRVLTLRKPPFLFQFQLLEALPDDLTSRQSYMLSIAPVFYVAAIDGEPLALPSTKLQIDALLQRLDEDGYMAVMNGVAENFGQAPGGDLGPVKK